MSTDWVGAMKSYGLGTQTSTGGTARLATGIVADALKMMTRKSFGDSQLTELVTLLKTMTDDEKKLALVFVCQNYKLYKPTGGFSGPLKAQQDTAWAKLEEYKKKFGMKTKDGQPTFQWTTMVRAMEMCCGLLEVCAEFRKFKPEFGYPSSALALHGLTLEEAKQYVRRRDILTIGFISQAMANKPTGDLPPGLGEQDLAKMSEDNFMIIMKNPQLCFWGAYIVPVTAIADLKEVRMAKDRQAQINDFKASTYDFLTKGLGMSSSTYPKTNEGLRKGLMDARANLYKLKVQSAGTRSDVFIANDNWSDTKSSFMKWEQ